MFLLEWWIFHFGLKFPLFMFTEHSALHAAEYTTDIRLLWPRLRDEPVHDKL